MSFIRLNLFGSKEKKPAASATQNHGSLTLKLFTLLNLFVTVLAQNCPPVPVVLDHNDDPLANQHEGLEVNAQFNTSFYKYFANLAYMSPLALIEWCGGKILSTSSVPATTMTPSSGAWTLLHIHYSAAEQSKHEIRFPTDAFYRATGDAVKEGFECCLAGVGNMLDSNKLILIASIAGCLLLMKLANQQDDECKQDMSRKENKGVYRW